MPAPAPNPTEVLVENDKDEGVLPGVEPDGDAKPRNRVILVEDLPTGVLLNEANSGGFFFSSTGRDEGGTTLANRGLAP